MTTHIPGRVGGVGCPELAGVRDYDFSGCLPFSASFKVYCRAEEEKGRS